MLAAILIQLAESLPIVDWTTHGMLSRPTIVSFVPDEPTTWTLAIIGAAAVGMYAFLSRFLRPREASKEVVVLSAKSTHRKSQNKPSQKQRKRRAA